MGLGDCNGLYTSEEVKKKEQKDKRMPTNKTVYQINAPHRDKLKRKQRKSTQNCPVKASSLKHSLCVESTKLLERCPLQRIVSRFTLIFEETCKDVSRGS